jgi:hypothetical protein
VRSYEKALFALCVLLPACARAGGTEPTRPTTLAASKPLDAVPTGAPRLSASAIARVPAGTFGPYLGMNARGGLSVWASAEAGARSWFARALSAHGDAIGDATRLGEAPSELGLVTVRALREGFALLSTHKVSDGEVVDLSILSDRGAKVAGPTSVGRATGSLLWVEAIPNARGASVLWAASGAGRAEIWAAEINAKAELTGTPRLLARDAGAWQAVPFGKGFALGVTHVGKASGAHGPIDLTLLGDPNGALAPIVINSEASADLDLDLAALGDTLALAWSDHRGGENRVFSCTVDQNGKVTAAAAPATPPLGEQAALRVVPPAEGSTRGYLAWEALDAQTPSHRTFQVAEFQPNGRVSSPRGLFEYWKMDGSMPEIAATPRGVAVLTLAPVCQRGAECTKATLVAPEFLEFDSGFAVRSTEPVWTEVARAPANLAWNLTCPNEACFVLTAANGAEAQVSLARLEHRSDAFRAPAERVELPPPPRIVSDEALAETAPLSQIALTETSAGTLLGWITDFDPTTPWVKLKKATADGRYEPLRARLDLQAFAAAEPFAPLAGAENLSLRAHSLGGIALAGSARQNDVLAAWAGLDNGQPQVFLTLVDKFGKKQAQRMLTHKTGELSDIAVLATGSDYFVAWVDERNSDPEVYATKVNHALNRIAPEQRITQAPGSATDVSLVQTHSGALLIWADARESEAPGAADVYSAALRGTDASRVAPEVCVQKTRTHSFSPAAREHGKNTFVAWLEAAADTGSDEPAHVNFADVDDTGHAIGSVQSVSLGAGTPVTLGLDCGDDVCHAVVSADDNSHNLLYALTFKGGKASPAVRIRSGAGAPSSVAPVIHGREVYVADTQQGRAHVRRLLLDW